MGGGGSASSVPAAARCAIVIICSPPPAMPSSLSERSAKSGQLRANSAMSVGRRRGRRGGRARASGRGGGRRGRRRHHVIQVGIAELHRHLPVDVIQHDEGVAQDGARVDAVLCAHEQLHHERELRRAGDLEGERLATPIEHRRLRPRRRLGRDAILHLEGARFLFPPVLPAPLGRVLITCD